MADSPTGDGVIKLVSLTIESQKPVKCAWSLKKGGSSSDAVSLSGSTLTAQSPSQFSSPSYVIPLTGLELEKIELSFEFSSKGKVLGRLEDVLGSTIVGFSKSTSLTHSMPSVGSVTFVFQLFGPSLMSHALTSPDTTLSQAAIRDLCALLNNPQQASPYASSSSIIRSVLKITSIDTKSKRSSQSSTQTITELWRLLFQPSNFMACMESAPNMLLSLVDTLVTKPKKVFMGNLELKSAILDLTKPLLDLRAGLPLLPVLSALLQLLLQELPKPKKEAENTSSSTISEGAQRLVTSVIRLLAFYDPKRIPSMIKADIILPCASQILKRWKELNATLLTSVVELFKFFGKANFQALEACGWVDAMQEISRDCEDIRIQLIVRKALELVCPTNNGSIASILSAVDQFSRSTDRRARLSLMHYIDSIMQTIKFSPEDHWAIYLRILSFGETSPESSDQLALAFTEQEMTWVIRIQEVQSPTFEMLLSSDFFGILVNICRDKRVPDKIKVPLLKRYSALRPTYPKISDNPENSLPIPLYISNGFVASKTASQSPSTMSPELLSLYDREKAILSRTKLFHRLLPTNLFESLDLTFLMLILWHCPDILAQTLQEDPLILQKVAFSIDASNVGGSCSRSCFVLSCLLFQVYTDDNFEFTERKVNQEAIDRFKDDICANHVPPLSPDQWASRHSTPSLVAQADDTNKLKSILVGQPDEIFISCLELLLPKGYYPISNTFVSSEGLSQYSGLFMTRIQAVAEKLWKNEILNAEASEVKSAAELRLVNLADIVSRAWRMYFSDSTIQLGSFALILNMILHHGLNTPLPLPTCQPWLSSLVEQLLAVNRKLWDQDLPFYPPKSSEGVTGRLVAGSTVEGLINLTSVALRGLGDFVKDTKSAVPGVNLGGSKTASGWCQLVEKLLERGSSAFESELMAERTRLRDILVETSQPEFLGLTEKLSVSLLTSSASLLERLQLAKEKAHSQGIAVNINPKLVANIESFYSSPPANLWKMFLAAMSSNLQLSFSAQVPQVLQRLYTTLTFGARIFPRLSLAILSNSDPAPNVSSHTSRQYQTAFSFFCNRISRLTPAEIETNAETLDSLLQVFYVPHLLSWSSPIYDYLQKYISWAATTAFSDNNTTTQFPIAIQAIELLLDFWLMLPTMEVPKTVRARNAQPCPFIGHLMTIMQQPSEILAKKAALLLHRSAYFATDAELAWYYSSTFSSLSVNPLVSNCSIPTFRYPYAMNLVCRFLAKLGKARFRTWINNDQRPTTMVEALSTSFSTLCKSMVELRKEPIQFLHSWIIQTKEFHATHQFIDHQCREVRSQLPIPLYDIIEKAIHTSLGVTKDEKSNPTANSSKDSPNEDSSSEDSDKPEPRVSATTPLVATPSNIQTNAFEGFTFFGQTKSAAPEPNAFFIAKLPPKAEKHGRPAGLSTVRYLEGLRKFVAKPQNVGHISGYRQHFTPLVSLTPYVFLVEELPLRSDTKNRWNFPEFTDDRAFLSKNEDFGLSGSNLQFDRYFHSILDDDMNCFLEIAENAQSMRNAIKEKMIPVGEGESTSLQIVAFELPSEIYRNELFGYFGTLVSSSTQSRVAEMRPTPEPTSSVPVAAQWEPHEVISYATEMITRHLLDTLQTLGEVLYYWAPQLADLLEVPERDSVLDWTVPPPRSNYINPSHVSWNLCYLMAFAEVANGAFYDISIFDSTLTAFDQKKFVGKKWKKALSLDPRYKFRPYIPVTMYWTWLGAMAQFENFLPLSIRTICGRITVALIKNDAETGFHHYSMVGEPLMRAVAIFGNFSTIPYFNHLAPRLLPKPSKSKSKEAMASSPSDLNTSDLIMDPSDRIDAWYEPIQHPTPTVPTGVFNPLYYPGQAPEPLTTNADPVGAGEKRKKVKPAKFRFTRIEGRVLPAYFAAYLPLLFSTIQELAKQLSSKKGDPEQTASEHPLRTYLELVPLMVKDHVEWCGESAAQVLIDAWANLKPHHRSIHQVGTGFLTSMTTAMAVLARNAGDLRRLMDIKPSDPQKWTTIGMNGLLNTGQIGTSFREIMVGLFNNFSNGQTTCAYISIGALVRLFGVLDPNFPLSEQSLSTIDEKLRNSACSGPSETGKGPELQHNKKSVSVAELRRPAPPPRRAMSESSDEDSDSFDEMIDSDNDPDEAPVVVMGIRAEDTREVMILREQGDDLLRCLLPVQAGIGDPLWLAMSTYCLPRTGVKWMYLVTPALPLFLSAVVLRGAAVIRPNNNQGFHPPLFTTIAYSHPISGTLIPSLLRTQALFQSKPLAVETALALRFLLPRLEQRATLVQYLLPASAYPPGFGKGLYLAEGAMKHLRLHLDRTSFSGAGFNPPESFIFYAAALACMPNYTLPTKLSTNAKLSHLKQNFGVNFMRTYGNQRLMKWLSLETAWNGIQTGQAYIPSFMHTNDNEQSLWCLAMDQQLLNKLNLYRHPTIPPMAQTHFFGVTMIDRVRTLWLDRSPAFVMGGDPNDPLYPRPNTTIITSTKIHSPMRHHFYLFNMSLNRHPVSRNMRIGFATKEAIQLLGTQEYGLCGIGDIPDSWGVCSTSMAIFREGSAQRTEVEFVDQLVSHPQGAFASHPSTLFYDPISNAFCVKSFLAPSSRTGNASCKSVTSIWVQLPNDRSLTLYPCISFYSTRRFIYWSDTEDRNFTATPHG